MKNIIFIFLIGLIGCEPKIEPIKGLWKYNVYVDNQLVEQSSCPNNSLGYSSGFYNLPPQSRIRIEHVFTHLNIEEITLIAPRGIVIDTNMYLVPKDILIIGDSRANKGE